MCVLAVMMEEGRGRRGGGDSVRWGCGSDGIADPRLFCLAGLCTLGTPVPSAPPLQWRTQFRRQMNRAEAEASSRAVDSLINYETVKYFDAEAHEQRRWVPRARGRKEGRKEGRPCCAA